MSPRIAALSRTYVDPRHRLEGFSLIELMVTVAIVGVLAAIALPSYRSYVLRGNRTDAIKAMAFDQQALERCYSQNFTYVDNPPTQPCSAAPGTPTDTTNNDYHLTFAINAASYVITAKTINAQAADTQCQTFTLTQAGVQAAQDSSGNDQTQACWGGH
jgi:type IV pilus assembly protein PilE